MDLMNKLMPNEAQMAGFLEPDDGSPIHRVNLLKYKDQADADGRETSLTGRKAYYLCSAGVKKCLEKVGGNLEFSSSVRRLALPRVVPHIFLW